MRRDWMVGLACRQGQRFLPLDWGSYHELDGAAVGDQGKETKQSQLPT